MAESMRVEYDYDSVSDPKFLQYWKTRGLVCASHETKLHRWKSAVPESAFAEPGRPLPVICVMQEVNHANEHLAVTECAYFYEYFRIAAQGSCILVSFVLEDAESNELLAEILEEAQRIFPMIDPSRVYIAGHSHNGHYALEFAFRHPDLIAAVATFGDPPGLTLGGITAVTEEKVEAMRKIDMPLIALAGCCEPTCLYPMNRAPEKLRPGRGPVPPGTFEQRAEAWRRRLRSMNCPEKTDEEITAAADSGNRAIRTLGIPADRGETLWAGGFEVYVADVRNCEGKDHFRIVGEQNMPHNTTPVQQDLSWTFLRRFLRDRETLKVLELN